MSVVIHLDVETRSVADLRKVGAYVYAEDLTTDVWCACYAIDDGEVKTWLPGEPCPSEITAHIESGCALFAHNAQFERAIWTHILTPRYGWPLPKLEQWNCTLARAYALALPGALDSAAAALGISEAKDPVGYRTMLRMSRPRRFNEDGTPVWWTDPVRIKELVAYCRQDVVVERALHERLIDLRPLEKQIWTLDAKINDRGVHVDRELCEIARALVVWETGQLNKEIRTVSKGLIPSIDSIAKIIDFLRQRGVDTDSVDAESVEKLLAKELPDDVRRVLEIRAEAGKASVKKIDALLNGCSKDGRARGLLAYHAASTGRWAGRRFQPQNIKRPIDKNQDELIEIIKLGSINAIRMLAGSPLEVVGDILRGLIIAAPGSSFYAADYSNIEGRGLAWLANETWKIKAFEAFDQGHGPDLYKLAYAKSFGLSPERVTPDQRQIGKTLELACGYQGGVGAFQTMASNFGIKVTDARADELKTAWREAHPNIKQFWYDVEDAAVSAVKQKGKTIHCGKLAFKVAGSFLFMRLPSGRMLTYPYPKLCETKTPWGSDKLSLTYKSVVNPSNNRRVVKDDGNSSGWARISTYGGSLVENATQAVARDVMAEAMLRVEAAGYPVALTIHDEILSERVGGSVTEFEELMVHSPTWAAGFPIAAQAWTGTRYRKN